jgi:hypothetical protein
LLPALVTRKPNGSRVPAKPLWRLGLGLALLGSVAARCGPKNECPLQVRQVFLAGKAPQVIVKNRAAYSIGNIVFHVAYQDLFPVYHDSTFAIDTIVQPGERVTLGLPPISGSVDWETLNVFATCQQVALDR